MVSHMSKASIRVEVGQTRGLVQMDWTGRHDASVPREDEGRCRIVASGWCRGAGDEAADSQHRRSVFVVAEADAGRDMPVPAV